VYGCCNLFEVQFHNRPLRSTQHYKSYATAFQVLLMTNVLVSRNEHIEAGILSSGQQVPVAEPIPSTLYLLRDGMASKKTSDACWSHMVKENEHLPGVQ
jgi:hypothetical protein